MFKKLELSVISLKLIKVLFILDAHRKITRLVLNMYEVCTYVDYVVSQHVRSP